MPKSRTRRQILGLLQLVGQNPQVIAVAVVDDDGQELLATSQLPAPSRTIVKRVQDCLDPTPG